MIQAIKVDENGKIVETAENENDELVPTDTDAPDTDAPDTDAPDTDAPDTDAPPMS